MAYFRIEVMDEKGKIIELRHVDLLARTVEQALHSVVVNRIRREAKERGYGFRVKREDS